MRSAAADAAVFGVASVNEGCETGSQVKVVIDVAHLLVPDAESGQDPCRTVTCALTRRPVYRIFRPQLMQM